ncbi:TPA: hypothetical protein IDX98_004857 [Escherichia coli]|nr:hypothetical protein [Escherichia coli]
MRQQQDEPGRFSICSRQAAVVLIYQGKVGGLFRERKNERVATDIDSRNKSSSSSHEYDSVLSFQFICDNGKEINVNLTNWNINIFPGQELIIYFVENSKKTKKYHT